MEIVKLSGQFIKFRNVEENLEIMNSDYSYTEDFIAEMVVEDYCIEGKATLDDEVYYVLGNMIEQGIYKLFLINNDVTKAITLINDDELKNNSLICNINFENDIYRESDYGYANLIINLEEKKLEDIYEWLQNIGELSDKHNGLYTNLALSIISNQDYLNKISEFAIKVIDSNSLSPLGYSQDIAENKGKENRVVGIYPLTCGVVWDIYKMLDDEFLIDSGESFVITEEIETRMNEILKENIAKLQLDSEDTEKFYYHIVDNIVMMHYKQQLDIATCLSLVAISNDEVDAMFKESPEDLLSFAVVDSCDSKDEACTIIDIITEANKNADRDENEILEEVIDNINVFNYDEKQKNDVSGFNLTFQKIMKKRNISSKKLGEILLDKIKTIIEHDEEINQLIEDEEQSKIV